MQCKSNADCNLNEIKNEQKCNGEQIVIKRKIKNVIKKLDQMNSILSIMPLVKQFFFSTQFKVCNYIFQELLQIDYISAMYKNILKYMK